MANIKKMAKSRASVRRATRGDRRPARRTLALRRGTVRSVVKSVVQSAMEKKYTSTVIQSYVLHNSPISAGDVVYCLPPVSQGVDENQRIGDRIRPVSLIVKGLVSYNSQVGGVQALQVKAYFLNHKKYKSQATLSTNIATEINELLDDGSGNLVPYDGTIRRSMYKVNGDLWTPIKTYTFTLSKDNTSTKTGPCFRQFTLRIPCPKVLTYADAANTLPENFCPCLGIGYNYVNGTAPDTVATNIMAFAESFFTYTDA